MRLKLITLNTQLLPLPATVPVGIASLIPDRLKRGAAELDDRLRPDREDTARERRASELARIILAEEPDVVCLQEVFDHRARRRLVERLSPFLPFIAEPRTDGLIPGNNGLMTLSRHRLAALPRCHTWAARAGSDALAAKGLLVTVFDLEGPVAVRLVVTNVHLQSGANHEAIRRAQLLEMRGAIATATDDVARDSDQDQVPRIVSLIGGDFNIAGESSEYAHIARFFPQPPGDTAPNPFGILDAAVAKNKTFPTHDEGRLDYWFILGRNALSPVTRDIVHSVSKLEARDAGYSDHDGVVMELQRDRGAFVEGREELLHALGDGLELASGALIGLVDKGIEALEPTEIALAVGGRPRGPDELVDDIAKTSKAPAGQNRSKPIGGHHAMSDIVHPHASGRRLDMRWMRRVDYVRPGAERLRFQAGATFDMLNRALGADDREAARGALLNQPGYGRLTFAGAMSVGGHGSSLKTGPLFDQVVALKINRGREARWHAWREQDVLGLGLGPDVSFEPSLMRAALVGLGLVGPISALIIKVRPSGFRIAETRTHSSWWRLQDELPRLYEEWRSPQPRPIPGSSISGIPHSLEVWINAYDLHDIVIGKRWETSAPVSRQRRLTLRQTPTTIAGQRLLERRKRGGRLDEDIADIQRTALASVVEPQAVVMTAAEGLSFGAPNSVDALAISMAVRLSQWPAAIEEIHRTLMNLRELDRGNQRHGRVLGSPIGVRFVPQLDEGSRPFMAPQFSDEATAMIEMPTFRDFQGAEETLTILCQTLMEKFGARPHWGQYLPITARHVQKAYPDDWEAFLGARRDLDPAFTGNNPFSERLGLQPPEVPDAMGLAEGHEE